MRFPFFKKKDFFSPEEKEKIVEAIRLAEKETSGEIRVFVESRNSFVDPIDRAGEIFFHLKMQNTEHRNAVLLYIAVKDRQFSVFGDQGIHEKVGTAYWNEVVQSMTEIFSQKNVSAGIIHCMQRIGETLKEKFPYEPTTDKNELPDEIVFGK